MTASGAPANGEDVTRIVPRPVVKGTTPAVESDMNLVVFDRIDRCAADQMRVLLVDRFEFLTDLNQIYIYKLEIIINPNYEMTLTSNKLCAGVGGSG